MALSAAANTIISLRRFHLPKQKPPLILLWTLAPTMFSLNLVC